MPALRRALSLTAALLLLVIVGLGQARAATTTTTTTTTYTVTLHTDMLSYTGVQPIKITGAVSPAPGPNTGVVIKITNPMNAIVDIDEATPSATNGSFSYTSIPGGSASWVSGSYVVNATWGGAGAYAMAAVDFTYTPAAATTSSTTTTTSSTTTTSTTTTTSSTTLPTTATSTTTTTSTAPEFPASVLAAVALLAMAAVALASRKATVPPAWASRRAR